MSSTSPQPAATLCTRCQVVMFDDSEFEGFKPSFNGNQEYLTYEPPPDLDTGTDSKFEFKVDFDLDDSLPSLPELAQGAADGCGFCDYLRRLLHSDEVQCRLNDMITIDWRTEQLPVSIFLYYRWGTWLFFNSEGLDSLVIGLYFDMSGLKTAQIPHLEMEIILSVGTEVENYYSDTETCAPWLSLYPSRQTDHSTTEILTWMKSHVQDCCEGRHSEKCNSHRGTMSIGSLPTRLVDLTGPIPRLVDGPQILSKALNGGQSTPHYAALSYCWGTKSHAENQLKTESSSLQSMMAGIPISSMTRAIRDAVELARALDIPYLWVDSLCIIQNDVEDWEKESSRMGAIYSNAFVTFCALGSSCHSSFLKPESPTLTVPFQSSIRSTVKGSYLLRYSFCAIGAAKTLGLLPDVSGSRWLQRGWTHQEFAMSARLLMFGPHFVHFLCPSLTAAQDETPVLAQWMFLLRGVSEDPIDLYHEWGMSVAPLYSDRHFTKNEDILPAISGLASYFSKALNDEYVAGLWKRDLVRGLMWSYQRNRERYPRFLNDLLTELDSPPVFIAPSWSWVGRRMLEFDMYRNMVIGPHDFLYYCKIEGKVEVLGQNPFGRVSNAELTITSYTYDMPLDITYEILRPAYARVDLPNNVAVMCSLDWRTFEPKSPLKLLLLGSVDWSDITRTIKTREAVRSNLMVEIDEATEQEDPEIDVFGLLLAPVTRKQGKYYRVGIFNSFSRQGGGLELLNKCIMETVDVI